MCGIALFQALDFMFSHFADKLMVKSHQQPNNQ